MTVIAAPHTSPTTGNHTDALIRAAVWTLPITGLLKMIGNLGTYNSVGYGISQASEAHTATQAGYVVGQLVGGVLPTVLTPLWAFALFVYAAPRIRARRTLVTALVAWIIGTGFTLAALGVVTYAVASLGHAYQHGDTTAMNTVDGFFAWPWVAMFYPAVLVTVAGILFTIATWRTRPLPRTAVVGFTLATALISAPGPLHPLHLAGGVLTLVCGAWIAYTTHRRLAQS